MRSCKSIYPGLCLLFLSLFFLGARPAHSQNTFPDTLTKALGEAGSDTAKIDFLLKAAETYVQLKNNSLAENSLVSASKIAEKINDLTRVLKVKLALSNLYSASGRHELAYSTYMDYIDLRDTLYNRTNTKKKVAAEMNFQFSKKRAVQKVEHENEVLRLETENTLYKRTRNYLIVIAGLGLLILVAGFVYSGNKKTLAAQEYYSQSLLRLQEEERQRISKELYESIGRDISELKDKLLKTGNVELCSSAENTLEEVNSLSKELYPIHLEKGLIPAIRELGEKINLSTGIRVNCSIDDLKTVPPGETAVGLYRILQECTSNAIKHARAETINIAAKQGDGLLTVTVMDNGTGFDKSVLKKKSQHSFGILNLEERVKSLGGKMEIHSEPGSGARFVFMIPA